MRSISETDRVFEDRFPLGPPRHYRLLWLLVPIGLITAVIAYIANYQPFAPGNAGVSPSCGYTTQMRSPGGEEFGLTVIGCAQGESSRFGHAFYNDGPFDVTITSVDGPFTSDLRPGSISLGAPVSIGNSTHNFYPDRQPFTEPYRFESGTIVELAFEAVMSDDCSGGGGRWFGLPITYKVFGITRHDTIPWQIRYTCTGEEPPTPTTPRRLVPN